MPRRHTVSRLNSREVLRPGSIVQTSKGILTILLDRANFLDLLKQADTTIFFETCSSVLVNCYCSECYCATGFAKPCRMKCLRQLHT